MAIPMASDDFPPPPGDPRTVVSPRTRSKPYNHWRCGMLENETFNSAADQTIGTDAVAIMGGDHPCHPCFLARSKTVAMVIGFSHLNASLMCLNQRLRFSSSLYPGALREAVSRISQSGSAWCL